MEHHLRCRLGILRSKTTQHTIKNKDITGTALLIFIFIYSTSLAVFRHFTNSKSVQSHPTPPPPPPSVRWLCTLVKMSKIVNDP